MKVYIMRHGTTVWNEKKISQGRSQNRLSKSGVELVKKQAQKFKDTKFDAIIVSPLFRTVQTANIMNKYHNVKKFKDERIIEIDQGIFTGKKVANLPPDILKKRLERSSDCKMESIDSIFERTKNFWDNLKIEYPFKNVLIVTHNWIASLLEILINDEKQNFKNEKQWSRFENAEVKCFEI